MVTAGFSARSPLWGHADLMRLVAAAGRGVRLSDMAHVARAPTVDARQVDLVLWTKLGRSVPEACDLLNGRAAALRSR